MSPKEDLNLPEEEQKEEAETENTVEAAEPVANMEEETFVSDVVETLTEKVIPTSELPMEEDSNRGESSISETKNIASEISALLDAPEENETELNEEENKIVSGEENLDVRDSGFLTEIDEMDDAGENVTNPVDNECPSLDTVENIGKVEDNIEKDKTVSSSTKNIKAEYTPASIVDTILAKAKSENTAITSENENINPGLVSIEDIEVSMIVDTEATRQVETIENKEEHTVSIEDIEATALNAVIENTEEESNLDLIESPEASAHTKHIVESEAITESEQTDNENNVDETKLALTEDSEKEQTASIEDKKAVDRVSETEAKTKSADIEVVCSVSCEASLAAEQTSSIGEIEATSTSVLVEPAANVEHVEAIKPEEYKETVETELIAHEDENFESQQLLEANNLMDDIKKEFNESSDNLREDCAAADEITPTNCTESSANKPLNTVTDIPLAEIALATLVIFLAIILFYN